MFLMEWFLIKKACTAIDSDDQSWFAMIMVTGRREGVREANCPKVQGASEHQILQGVGGLIG